MEILTAHTMLGLGSSAYSYKKITDLMVRHMNQGTKLSISELPSKFELSGNVWKELRNIAKYTSIENRERGTTVFWADGDIVPSPNTRGQKQHVVTKHTAQLKYEPTSPGWYNKVITINNKIVKKNSIQATKLPKEAVLFPIYNIHTHPHHEDEQGREYFNLFSQTDINSLINGSSIASGLITNKLWMIFKTQTTSVLSRNFQQDLPGIASRFTLHEEEKLMTLKGLFYANGMVLYRAEWGKKLEKV